MRLGVQKPKKGILSRAWKPGRALGPQGVGGFFGGFWAFGVSVRALFFGAFFGVQGLGFRVWGLGFVVVSVSGLGFGISG